MKIRYSVLQRWVSIERMRLFGYTLIFFSFATTACAQSPAGDKDALDLSAKMDTIAHWGENYDVVRNLNVGLQNPDQWEDFLIDSWYGGSSDYGAMRYGGPLIFDSLALGLQVEGDPTAYADLDGDGIGDLITSNVLWYKGRTIPPYFDTSSNARLQFHDFPDVGVISTSDYTSDGISDLLVDAEYGGQFGAIIYRFDGGTSFHSTSTIAPSDSLILGSLYISVVGQFNPNKKPTLILGQARTLGVVSNINDLAHDSLVLISDTSTNGMTIYRLFAMDITGDGIPDLLVSDGLRIYIFKGGDDFGAYPLTAANAYYVIQSPRLLDFGSQYGFIKNFGMRMHSCGDITGSGIPYLAVEAEINESGLYKGFTFFYAGGKALDSLYDAFIGYDNGASIFSDTLHSINSTGRTVGLIYKGDANGGFGYDLLFSRDCELIPHRTNPNLDRGVRSEQPTDAMRMDARSGGGFVTITIDGSGEGDYALEIYDMLGKLMARRIIGFIDGRDREQFSTDTFTDGTYIALLRGAHSNLSARFIANRALRDQAPESPLLQEVHQSELGMAPRFMR